MLVALRAGRVARRTPAEWLCVLRSDLVQPEPPCPHLTLRTVPFRRGLSAGSGPGVGSSADAVLRAATETDEDHMLHEASTLARRVPGDLTAEDMAAALALQARLPRGPRELVASIGHQLLRVLLSYEHWYLPTAWRSDGAGASGRWHGSVPLPGGPQGARALPLFSDGEVAQSVRFSGSTGRTEPMKVTGHQALVEYLKSRPSERFEGIVLNLGNEHQLTLANLALLNTWEATLRLEALMREELGDQVSAEEHAPASSALARALAQGAPLSVVRTPDNTNLAADASGRNFLVLTSADAAAVSARCHGKELVRSCEPSELLRMAEDAKGAFGFALTLGPDRMASAAEGGRMPGWETRKVTAAWFASALRLGAADDADRGDSAS